MNISSFSNISRKDSKGIQGNNIIVIEEEEDLVNTSLNNLIPKDFLS